MYKCIVNIVKSISLFQKNIFTTFNLYCSSMCC